MATKQVEVVVGVIGRAYGLHGEVTVEPRTDEPDRRFAAGQVLRAEDASASFSVVRARYHSGRLVVSFEELPDRTAAEAARGTTLVLDVAADEGPDTDDEYYDRQLVGLRVLDVAGAEVGRVSAVVHLPAQDLLEVLTDAGPRLVPFVAELVPEVDLAGGLVRLADVAGLLHDDESD